MSIQAMLSMPNDESPLYCDAGISDAVVTE